MSYKRLSQLIAVACTTFVLSAVAYVDAGKSSMVLGERVSGSSKPASRVLGKEASGSAAASAAAARPARGSLPFTGTGLVLVLIAAGVALLRGFALRRALTCRTQS
jgi:hypothetical protein